MIPVCPYDSDENSSVNQLRGGQKAEETDNKGNGLEPATRNDSQKTVRRDGAIFHSMTLW